MSTRAKALMFDAVTVIEFPPGYEPGAARAEARALFFLAGWGEHAAREFAPCLVCIDEPPPSVCWLAERTGARLVRHPSTSREGREIFHPARAWDPETGDRENVLALDPEVIAIGDPAPALAILPDGPILAVAPAAKPQVPEAVWPVIYHALDLPMAVERMRPLRAELGVQKRRRKDDMPPFYHPAVVLAPRAGAFGALWAGHAARLTTEWPTLDGLPAKVRDHPASIIRQAALSTAVQAARMENGGAMFQTLPAAWDGRRARLEGGTPLGEMMLLHVPGLFDELTDPAQIPIWLHGVAERWRAALLTGSQPVRTQWWVLWQTRRMEAALRRLYRRHVYPALQMGGSLADNPDGSRNALED